MKWTGEKGGRGVERNREEGVVPSKDFKSRTCLSQHLFNLMLYCWRHYNISIDLTIIYLRKLGVVWFKKKKIVIFSNALFNCTPPTVHLVHFCVSETTCSQRWIIIELFTQGNTWFQRVKPLLLHISFGLNISVAL